MDRVDMEGEDPGFKHAYDYTRQQAQYATESPSHLATPPSSYLHSSSVSGSGSGSGHSGVPAESSRRTEMTAAVAVGQPRHRMEVEDPRALTRAARSESSRHHSSQSRHQAPSSHGHHSSSAHRHGSSSHRHASSSHQPVPSSQQPAPSPHQEGPSPRRRRRKNDPGCMDDCVIL